MIVRIRLHGQCAIQTVYQQILLIFTDSPHVQEQAIIFHSPYHGDRRMAKLSLQPTGLYFQRPNRYSPTRQMLARHGPSSHLGKGVYKFNDAMIIHRLTALLANLLGTIVNG